MIQDRRGIPINDQRLIFDRDALEIGWRTLREYHIAPLSSLDLVLR